MNEFLLVSFDVRSDVEEKLESFGEMVVDLFEEGRREREREGSAFNPQL